jgi:hypothetical protein
MKKALKIAVIILVLGFIVAQFIRPDQTNPSIVAAETIEAATPIPENVNAILTRSCNDCHSNKTVYPWYAQITPANWLLAHHIDEGRRELNLSVWQTYDARKKKRKLDEICEQIETGEMPHNQYLWIHRAAKLSDEDKKLLCDWSAAEKEKLVVAQ